MARFAEIGRSVELVLTDSSVQSLAAQFAARLEGSIEERSHIASEVAAFVAGYVKWAIALGSGVENLAEASPSIAELAKFADGVAAYWADPLDVVPDSGGLFGRLDDAYFTHRAFQRLILAIPKGRIAEGQEAALAVGRLLGPSVVTELETRVETAVRAINVAAAAQAIWVSRIDGTRSNDSYLARGLPRPPVVPDRLEGFADLTRRGSITVPADEWTIPGVRPGDEGWIYDVWFGTNRMPVDANDLKKGFLNERDPERRVRYGQCSVYIPRTHLFGSLGTPWWKRWRKLKFSDDHLRLELIDPFESEDAFCRELRAELSALADDSRAVLVYIHGFNVSFEEAALRAAQIGFDLKVPGATAFFSWPSAAQTSEYVADIARAEASERELAAFLEMIAAKVAASTVHVIAHSMGNRAFGRAIARMTRKTELATGVRFGQIILAAPDVDVDLFHDLAAVYPQISTRTTMYVSAKDRALSLSRWLQDSDRAGYTPPITVLPGIDTVEVTSIDVTLLGHGYYAEAATILYDMRDLINGNLPPQKRARISAQLSGQQRYWAVGA